MDKESIYSCLTGLLIIIINNNLIINSYVEFESELKVLQLPEDTRDSVTFLKCHWTVFTILPKASTAQEHETREEEVGRRNRRKRGGGGG